MISYPLDLRDTLEIRNTALRKIDRVQERASRLIGPANAADLPLLAHRRGVKALTSMHRLVYGYAPAPVLQLCPQRSTLQPRHGQPPFLDRPKKGCLTPKYWTNSFVPLATEAWNQLSPDIQKLTDPASFKHAVNATSLPLGLLNLSGP